MMIKTLYYMRNPGAEKCTSAPSQINQSKGNGDVYVQGEKGRQRATERPLITTKRC